VVFRKKWYFYRTDIIVEDAVQGDVVIERLKGHPKLLREPEKMPYTRSDAVIGSPKKYIKIQRQPVKTKPVQCLIKTAFRDKNKKEAAETTKELKNKFPNCIDISEWVGYEDYISREERECRKKKRDRRNNSLKSAGIVYVFTVLGGGTLTGFFNQVTLNTPPHAYIDAFFKAAMVAIPAFILVYKKESGQKSQQPN
jgi:hypothetical protein